MLKLPGDVVQRLKSSYVDRSVCVTGGAGFIGGHLVDALLSLGARITVLDDLSNSSLSYLADLVEMEPDRIRFVHGSILDPTALSEALKGVECVFHLAAMVSVPLSVQEPLRSFAVNAEGTLRVAHGAHQAGASRIIYSGSSSAYGASEALPKDEGMLPEPISPYGASKLDGEQVMRVWAETYGMSTLTLRYFNIFGPRQRADSPYSGVIAIFARKLLAGQAPVIFGDGEQTRDFTYVANAVYANLLAGATDCRLHGQVVNIGTGEQRTLNDLARMMAQECGVPHLTPTYEPARQGDVLHSLADVGAARALLDYDILVPVEEGLRETVQWYRTVDAETEECREPGGGSEPDGGGA